MSEMLMIWALIVFCPLAIICCIQPDDRISLRRFLLLIVIAEILLFLPMAIHGRGIASCFGDCKIVKNVKMKS